MANILRLGDFEVQSGTQSGYLILVNGDSRYKDLLKRAFPQCTFTASFPDRHGRYEWGTYIHGLDDRSSVESFLHLLTQYLYIVDDFEECFSLARHTSWDPTARESRRTELGEVLYRAKYRDDRSAADTLVERVALFIEGHPTYRRANAVVPVPPSNPNKPFDCPSYLARQLAERLGKTDGTGWAKRIRVTR